ncbi:PREDICTED: regulator of G-protein signaling rgs-2-like [Rhagoletis zephyria]|uniref:regulator of G-protein signaling rgs-2-like n=1 Tax=Rhagoletis zephyria TaxID=28612 RepID=UPI00081166F9|nr:PREDICTED: regulator of G-protein signaling rgs-2-like [Rhagoletis zephyria]
MTGDKVEVHNEPSSILSDGQRDDSNGTAPNHSQQAAANAAEAAATANGDQAQQQHHCRNNCLSIRTSEKSKENKMQLSSIENYFNGENEPPPTLEEIRSWADSFDRLMRTSTGRKVFRDFLKCEYSEENIMFWQACEDLRKCTDSDTIEEKARSIYDDFISILSPREVSLDSRVREIINRNMLEPSPHTFDEAQLQIYTLMHRDSYPRFINSPAYRKLAQLPTPSRKGSAV